MDGRKLTPIKDIKNDFDIFFKKVLYRVKNGMTIDGAINELGGFDRVMFYKNLSPEQYNELRLARSAYYFGPKKLPSLKTLDKDVTDVFSIEKNDDDLFSESKLNRTIKLVLIEQSVKGIVYDVKDVLPILVDIITHKKIDNISGLLQAIKDINPTEAVKILVFGSDIRPEDKEKLKSFFERSDIKKVMINLKTELNKFPIVSNLINKIKDQSKEVVDKMTSIFSESVGEEGDIEERTIKIFKRMKKNIIKLDESDILRIVKRAIQKENTGGNLVLPIKTITSLEKSLNELKGKTVNVTQQGTNTPVKGSPFKIEYVTPILNYSDETNLLKRRSAIPESFIEMTYFDGEGKEGSLIVFLLVKNKKIIASPEIYNNTNPNSRIIDKSIKGENKDITDFINAKLNYITLNENVIKESENEEKINKLRKIMRDMVQEYSILYGMVDYHKDKGNLEMVDKYKRKIELLKNKEDSILDMIKDIQSKTN